MRAVWRGRRWGIVREVDNDALRVLDSQVIGVTVK